MTKTKIAARAVLLCFFLAAAAGLGLLFWREPSIGALFCGVALLAWAIGNA